MTSADSGTELPTGPAVRPSLRRNSLARLASIGARVVLGTASAVITARALGPYGKGTLSSLLFVTVLLSLICSLGLGDAATVLAGAGRVDLRTTLARAVPAIVPATVLGIGALVVTAAIASWEGIAVAVGWAAVLLVLSIFVYVASSLVDAMERLTFTALVSTVGAATALVLTFVLVGPLDLGITGGVAAATGGALVMSVAYVTTLHRSGFAMRPVLDRSYLRPALRLGAVLQATALLGSAGDRADLLLVYALGGASEAGIYAVALSIGQLALYTSSAISNAVFPRIASVDPAEVPRLIAIGVRISTITAAASALLVAAAAPVVLDVLFGSDYGDAVLPAVLIAFAAIAGGPQLTLARAAAARERGALYLSSYGTSVVAMLALDVALVPDHGATGAAIATLAAAAAGLLVAVIGAARADLISVAAIRPRASDITYLVANVREIAGRRTR